MFKALEMRANMLCAGILIGTIVIGKMFGGALKGLVPLGMCLASGVYLWMKEVIRSGREVEWDSEQVRGQMASIRQVISAELLANYDTGLSELASGISRMDEHIFEHRLGSH